MEGAGTAVMGIGRAAGENRAHQAAEKAIVSPMLEVSMEGAAGVLLSIAGPSGMTLHEVNAAAIAVAEYCDPDANVIFGAFIDDAMGDEMRVTVIAAGFHKGRGRPRLEPPSVTRTEPDAESIDDFGVAEPGSDDESEIGDVEIPDFLKG
jgi:cell division protein FtsZ